jgi:alpha-tubulin suppressor-like RCC1 family protein
MDRFTPVVAGVGASNIRTLDGGINHTVALIADGTARAWGNNQFGQLGDGTTTQRTLPVTVSGLTGASAPSAGGYLSFARC